MPKPLAIAIDLGASKLRVCLGNRRGRILKRVTREMTTEGPIEDYLSTITETTKEILRQAPSKEIAAIGVASFGPFDHKKKGIIRNPPNVPFKYIPIVESLRDAIGLDVVLINDAKAAAIGEKVFGLGRKVENLVYVTISTGIGGGVFVDGHLLIGKDGNATEVGHMTIDPASSLTCGCGRRGHWEAYCSGRNIPNFAKLLYDGLSESERIHHKNSGVAWRPKTTTPGIFQAAIRGDEFAQFVVQEVGKLNSLGVANLVSLYDPSLVTIGGGVALKNPYLILNPIMKSLPEYTINKIPKIALTPLGEDICLLGAMSVAFDPGILHEK